MNPLDFRGLGPIMIIAAPDAKSIPVVKDRLMNGLPNASYVKAFTCDDKVSVIKEKLNQVRPSATTIIDMTGESDEDDWKDKACMYRKLNALTIDFVTSKPPETDTLPSIIFLTYRTISETPSPHSVFSNLPSSFPYAVSSFLFARVVSRKGFEDLAQVDFLIRRAPKELSGKVVYDEYFSFTADVGAEVIDGIGTMTGSFLQYMGRILCRTRRAATRFNPYRTGKAPRKSPTRQTRKRLKRKNN